MFDLAHSFGAYAEATGDLAQSLLAATDPVAEQMTIRSRTVSRARRRGSSVAHTRYGLGR